jgi:hydrogenase expression/formation protein HypD
LDRSKTTAYVDRIRHAVGVKPSIKIMEVCGTHTVSLFRTGVRSLLPEGVWMISGPGCPVCVTTQGYIDAACELAERADVVIATYGDMIRVPGTNGSLDQMRARGARVRMVYSARDCLTLAREHPGSEVVFLAVGFETTSPATAAMLIEAKRSAVGNVSVLSGHKLVVPALHALLSGGNTAIDGFLLPGHVSVILGVDAYRSVVGAYGKPCVVAGFEAEAMLRGIARLAELIAGGEADLENAYGVAVTNAGNAVALKWLDEVFEPSDVEWRAMGVIAKSGLALRAEYRAFDACAKLGVQIGPDVEPPGCRCGEVIQGLTEPAACELFSTACTPSSPVGPCMVSSEGACAAWFTYGAPKHETGGRNET